MLPFFLLFASASLAPAETVTKSITIERPLEEVFPFVTTARHWPKWHPATVEVDGDIDRPMRLGDRIREKARIGPAAGTGEWTVVAHQPNRSVTLSLPRTRLGDLTIRYGFQAVEGGTLFRRELTFDLSALPPQLDPDKIRQQMDRDSQLALANIKRLIEQ